MERRLAAILAADVVGYSRLMGGDEEATLATLNAYREVIDRLVADHRGRVFGSAGDSVIAEFASPVEAVRCAVEIQQQIEARNANLPEDRRMRFRIGVNLGDVMAEGDNLFGDGVNVAARLEALCEGGGVTLSGNVHEQVQGKLDERFEDAGEQEVKNIVRPIRVWRWSEKVTENMPTAPPGTEALPLPDKPTVAVLPFENLSGDPEQEYFADGITEDIITVLSLWRTFPVIARHSTFTYKGRAVKVQQVAEELGARYVIEGSVRKSGDRVRITAQLIDAVSGHHIWAQKFDRDLVDIFELQDEISQRITATVQPELERAEEKRSVVNKPQNLDAWDYYQRGISLLYKFTKEGNKRAREMFEKALALDPNYSQAFSGLAYSHHHDIWLEYTDSRENSVAKCLEAARTAVAFDDRDAFAHMVLGAAFSWAGRHDLAVAAEERAVEINPSNAVAHVTLGHALDCAGRSEEGIPHIEKGLQLNPRDSRNHFYMALLARTHLSARRYEEAVEWARKAIYGQSDYLDAHLVLAASLGHLGRRTEARAALDECQRIQPGFVEKRAGLEVYQNRVNNEHILDGLRKAGLPE